VLELECAEYGGMYLAKDPYCFFGNDDIPAAPVNKCRVRRFLYGIIDGELVEHCIG
jgi:hypothetical protein